ncbi:death-associated protein kinase 1-like isoform X4 [Halichondria panicea]
MLELLQRGAAPNSDYYTKERDGLTPLHIACTYNHIGNAELLIKFGAIVAATDNNGWTPLQKVCLHNRKATAKLLLEHHSPTDIWYSNGRRTAADMAKECGHCALADYVKRFQPGPRDPLSSYPTLEQLSRLECDQWLRLGVRLGLGNDQLETIKKSQHPTATTLQAAKLKNIDMQWKDIVESLVSIGEYKLAESVCTQQGLGEGESAIYGCVRRLVETMGLNPKEPVNKSGDTPFSLACANGHLDTVKYLVNKHHCDPRSTVNKTGDTPLSLACVNGHLEMIKYFIIIHGCIINDYLLLAAVKGNRNQRAVEYFLAECHCDPNVTDKEGKTPLDLANDPENIKLLLKHGAKATNVYKKHSKLIGKLSSERLPHLPLSVFITGDGGVGKSTLLKSILNSKGFWSIFQKATPVDDVDARTVGIIPYEIYTKEFGRIIYFDFAGQKEFYTSHCAILENAVKTSPPIIILCAKLVESEQAIIDTMNRWLTLIQNQCTNLKDKAHVIVVGSHADQMKEMGEDPRAKEGIFSPIIKQFPKFEFTGFIPMDCRFADSDDMNIMRKQIQKSSAILHSPETISLNAHTFYIYLAENFKDKLAVSLKVVQQRILSDLDQTHDSEIMADILSFIPTTLNRLVDICDQLSKTGLLLFLYNESSPKKSFLICDSKKLLSDVTGTVFAPKHFRQHCKLASSTGVVPLSKYAEAFKGYDIEMLIAFMTHLELCFEIKDKQVLECIHKMEPDLDDTRYLFFPGLIRIETPERVWEEDPSMSYHFGWIIECAQDIQFFDPRSFQILILRLVFTFCLTPSEKINTKNPALQKFCSVWKSGICWCNDDSITAYLELSNNKCITLKMRSEVLKPESLTHRYKIVNKVLETVKDVCPSIVVVESLINPQEVVSHPLKPSSELTLFSVRDLAAAVISQKEAVKSVHRALSLKRLLQFDPYAGLDLNTLQCIHSDKTVMKNDKIWNIFISHLASQIFDPNSILMFRQILSQSRACNDNFQLVSPRQEVVQTLETWRSETEGTYSCLKETLNKYSVFTGRNPLDLAGVAHGDIDPSVFNISSDEQKDPGTTILHEFMVKHGVTDEQLDREIEQDDLAPVAMHFDDVELYLNPLKLTDNEQSDVRRETYLSRSNQVAVINCLLIWRGHEPSEATFGALIRILLDLGKEEMATKICQYLKQKVISIDPLYSDWPTSLLC